MKKSKIYLLSILIFIFALSKVLFAQGEQQFDANRIAMYVQPNGVIGQKTTEPLQGFEWPKGSGKKGMWAGSIWIGANVGGDVRTAAYRREAEFSPGPINGIGGNAADPNDPKYRVYKISSPTDPDYSEWPIELGAPVMNDGTTPRIFGDQTLFNVYNDLDPIKHLPNSGFGTSPLGAEVQQTVYGFNGPDVLSDVVFIKFKVINKSNDTWTNTYIAFWDDPDLGYWADDLVGVDVPRNMGYVYNGDDFDEDNGDILGYGLTPPALGIKILQGSLPTNPIQTFAYYYGSAPDPLNDPENGTEAYNFMQGFRSDGSPYLDPTEGNSPTVFPLSGDPVVPSGWIDSGTGDRRVLLSSGPFNLAPGESTEMIAAIVVAQGEDRLSSISSLDLAADAVQSFHIFVVNSTGDGGDSNPGDGICDDGKGFSTLRAAIEEANASPGLDLIEFDIPGSGPYTIQPLSALPTITDPVVIDATTQPGFSGSPLIEINGALAGSNVHGLIITAGNSIVQGLVINGFNGDGIRLLVGSHNTVRGNFIGTNITGTSAVPNGGTGMTAWSGINQIIGNVISGNKIFGIDLVGHDASSGSNVVQGNFIGTNSTGNAPLPNGTFTYSHGGVNVTSDNNTIGGTSITERNVISGNIGRGVEIVAFAKGNNVLGNYIGTNAFGSSAIGNTVDGIVVGAASENIIGGSVLGSKNVISGNGHYGVWIVGDAHNNSILGNYIGTSADGSTTLGNGSNGVNISTSSNNIIGGIATGAGNLISGNIGYGIAISGDSVEANGNIIQGNLIGTDISGTLKLGNVLSGISIEGVSSNNIIWGI